MIKKIILSFFLLSVFFSGEVFANDDAEAARLAERQKQISAELSQKSESVKSAEKAYNEYKAKITGEPTPEQQQQLDAMKDDIIDAYMDRNATVTELNQVHKDACKISKDCLDTASFELQVTDFAPGGSFSGDSGNFSQKVDKFLGNIIQQLVLMIGVIAVFVMTLGGGYMIINSGQDELVNKGKSMFMAGIYAVVIALGSYLIVGMLRYLIYSL